MPLFDVTGREGADCPGVKGEEKSGLGPRMLHRAVDEGGGQPCSVATAQGLWLPQAVAE